MSTEANEEAQNAPIKKKSKFKKFLAIFITIIFIVLAGFLYFRFYFVFGDGVKAGTLNYFMNKGYVFKTYEGKLIQAGFKGSAGNTINSNEFKFSVEEQSVADSLMRCSGKNVELHYKEYIHTLPWRGVSIYVVDSIVAVH